MLLLPIVFVVVVYVTVVVIVVVVVAIFVTFGAKKPHPSLRREGSGFTYSKS